MTPVNLPYSQVLTRSRTLLFLSFRDTRSSSVYPPRLSRSKGKQRQTDDAEQEALLNHDEATTAIDIQESSSLPPRWVDFAEEVEEFVDQIRPKMVQLDKLTAKHILPGFTDRSTEERQIESLTHEITQGFRKCQLLIRKIADIGLDMEAQINRSRTQGSQGNAQLNYTTRDVTLVKNAQIAAATKVQNLSSLFQKRQRVYLQQLRGYEIPSSSPGKNAMLAIEDDSHGEHALSEQAQLYSQQTSYHRASQDVEQRTKEIEGIAQSISELADMFKDLGNLILDQGTLLDRIDYNVERMSNDVKGAVEELKIATQHQKRSGKCRIIFLLILLIFAAVLILVFKPRHRPDNQQTNPPSNSKRSIFLDRHMPRSPLTLFGLPVKSHATRSTPVRETLRCARWKTC